MTTKHLAMMIGGTFPHTYLRYLRWHSYQSGDRHGGVEKPESLQKLSALTASSSALIEASAPFTAQFLPEWMHRTSLLVHLPSHRPSLA